MIRKKNRNVKLKPKEKKESTKDENALNSNDIFYNFFKIIDKSQHQNKKKFSVKEKLKTWDEGVTWTL